MLELFPAVKDEIFPKVKTKLNGINDGLAQSKWKECLEIIKDNVPSQVYLTWFEPIKALRLSNDKLVVKVPSQFYCEWIEEHYYPLLEKTIKKCLGTDVALEYEVVIEDTGDTLEERTIKMPAFKYPQNKTEVKTNSDDRAFEFTSFLNPRYTFENFIQGDNNQFASSASIAISDNPGTTRFNPLIIYGETGLGKTHLVQSIGNRIIQNKKAKRVLYSTSERFAMEFINSIQNNKINEFSNFYRSVDVLIIDDIQFFQGKEKTQDNFFHTFNAIHQAGKQIVLTSDKPPRDLHDVDDRLISRFQWGLIVDIQPPDYETRIAILQRKSKDEGIELPCDVLDYLAKHTTSNVRELEGTLISLIAKHTFERKELNVDLAKEIVHGIASVKEKEISLNTIKEVVAAHFKLTVEALDSKSRKQEIALARQMAMYLTKEFTQLSLKSIGKQFGDRDHTTVIHSCKSIVNLISTNQNIKNSFQTLISKIKR